jgi:putative FmdB family regulatory protein
MPVYEYECSACGHRFEEWQKITDKPVKTCPKCKARKVERLISQTSFHLKGGGWYGDLYSSTKGGAGSSSGGSGSSGSSSEPSASTKESPSKPSGSKKSKPAA